MNQPTLSIARSLSAAVLLLLGSAAAYAAPVDDRAIVLSYVASDFFTQYVRHPDVLTEYEGEPGFATDEFLERSGALSVGMARVGTPDDKVGAEAMVGRAFLLRGDRAGARPRLESALAAAAALGWDDRRVNGVLRDLAWLTEAGGDTAAAANYASRASACPVPCAEDALPLLHAEAAAAAETVYAALGTDLGSARIDAAEGADMIAFVEAAFGPASEEAMDAWHSRAVAARDERPWQALDFYQRLLDLRQAAGIADAETLDVRRAIATLFLEAGEYRRLATFAAALIPDALDAARTQPDILYLPEIAMTTSRLRARALWHLRDPEARAAYGVAIETMFEFGDGGMARILLQDLIDARYDEETVRIADALLRGSPGDADALFAKARVAARRGDFAAAASLVGEISEQGQIAVLQRAAYLEKAGKAEEAAALRAGVAVGDPEDLAGWSAWSELGALIDPRDFGAYEGAAGAAHAYLDMAERMVISGSYVDAQRLWQIAYTLAMGGEVANSFRLMKDAASIAARLSFADANDTDGGSLQLLRRDKFRYLLFVDIAWAAATGAPPDSMSVSSRY